MNTRLLIILTYLSGAVGAWAKPAPQFTADGFKVPQPGFDFQFPRDHGSHPGFKIEWWYLTGHLAEEGANGERFGFQATFFRQASPDGNTDLFLSHMAVVNVSTGEFLHQERLNRPGWDAGATVGRLDLHNGPWSLRMPKADAEEMRLQGGVRAEAMFDLQLEPVKPLVIFGEDGVSRKGAAPTAASYYLTYSRLAATGTLNWQGKTRAVTGLAWMDHEISSSQLDENQVGWDWISMQLNDGREIMVYRLRLRDGSSDPASTLTWVDANAQPMPQPFEWQVVSTWTSETTGGTYPAKVRVRTIDPASGQSVSLLIEPMVAAQELSGDLGGIPYWEGACRVRDETEQVLGQAYMELTGYAKDLELQ